MSDQALWITLWVASGVFIGGVVTPLVAENKRLSGFLAMLIGVVVGAVGNVILLLPLWLMLGRLPSDRSDTRPAWQRDMAEFGRVEEPAPALSLRDALAEIRRLLWPAPRTDGHSHRQAYVSVFVALAIITAIEVLLTVLDLGISMTGPLVMLSSLKVLLVVLFFMHLRYDSRWYSAVFVYTVPFAALVLIILALS
ncbi:MAG: hypothetical protein EHM39_05865 [Chloroflexi bacterium]|nr:MAG: hypothetical protein EHM39_05865 [Chloroflexota bacterium]